MKRTNWTAWLLIGAGVVLLLNHFNLLDSNRVTTALFLSAFLIFVFVNRARQNPHRKGIIGAVFFTAFFMILLFMKMGWLPVDDRLGSGLLLVSLGFANLVYFLITKRKFSNFVYAIIFIVIGIPFIIGYYRWMDLWELENLYTVYWPVILIIVGLALLIDGYVKHTAAKRKLNSHNADTPE